MQNTIDVARRVDNETGLEWSLVCRYAELVGFGGDRRRALGAVWSCR